MNEGHHEQNDRRGQGHAVNVALVLDSIGLLLGSALLVVAIWSITQGDRRVGMALIATLAAFLWIRGIASRLAGATWKAQLAFQLPIVICASIVCLVGLGVTWRGWLTLLGFVIAWSAGFMWVHWKERKSSESQLKRGEE